MTLDKDVAKKTSEVLLQINAIKLNPKEPFTWASGWKSPIYCDNRLILSYPTIRTFIRECMAKQIEEIYGRPDVIAAVATGAIGIGALVAGFLSLPFIYVRPETKKHGRKNQIEGYLESGQNVVVIEDLISTGNSSLNAVKALKKANANVKGMLAIFSYNFPEATKSFEKENLEYYALSDYDYLLEQALETRYISDKDLITLEEWNKNPSQWNAF